MNNYTVFISDLHLSATKHTTTTLFAKYITEMASNADAVYILGDLFKLWYGDDDCSDFVQEMKNILKKISYKIPVYLMPGNRDFLMGKTFAQECNCTLISDPYKLNLYNRPTLLTHGDILCTKDIHYKLFRSVIHIPGGKKCFLKLPFKIRANLATAIQKYTTKNKLTKTKKVLQPQIDTIKKLMTKYQTNQIIHGHTHNIETEDFITHGQKMRRISLGEWTVDVGNALIYYPTADFEFKTFD